MSCEGVGRRGKGEGGGGGGGGACGGSIQGGQNNTSVNKGGQNNTSANHTSAKLPKSCCFNIFIHVYQYVMYIFSLQSSKHKRS